MIWAKCPKEIFVNKRRVKRAVTEAVCEYNKGTVRTIVETQKALGVATGGSTKQLATILDCRKQKFRKCRQNAMPTRTIRRRLQQSGLSARRLLLGLPLTQNDRRFRHQWCDERRMWDAEWNDVAYTDE
ncbi:transposable element Tcb1 transposase [Trichonephila clavipes]|nr:transposable element Tcb1 transposase [Trichonephila clavipes]